MDARWWVQVLVVGVGGFVGAVARHGLSNATHRLVGDAFPAGTLLVNALGCLLIGFVLYLALERGHFSATTKLLIVTGFLGSLTTFSTFGHETLDLLRNGKGWAAMTNIAANVFIGLIAVAAGWAIAGRLVPEAEATEMKTVALSADQQDGAQDDGVEQMLKPEDVFDEKRIRVGATEYPFRAYTPDEYVPEGGWPCIVFLHGRGECGDDNALQLVNGLPQEVAKDPEAWPFIVIAPQKPTQNSEWEDHAKAVKKMVMRAVEAGAVNPDRVALTGLSQGGHGTWAIAAKYPGMFRALMPVCGYVNPPGWEDGRRGFDEKFDGSSKLAQSIVETCIDLPMKIIHGGADDVVPASESEGMARVLARLGGQPELTIYEGVNHNAWDRAYSAPGLAEWFARVTAPLEEEGE